LLGSSTDQYNIIITLYRGFVFRHDSWKFAHGAFNNNHSFITISYTKLTERLKISNKQYIFKVNRTCRYYRQLEIFNLTVFTSKAVRRSWVRTLSGRTKDYKIGICCFSTKHKCCYNQEKWRYEKHNHTNSPRVDVLFHSDTLFWFRGNQSVYVLLNAVCFVEKQQIPIL
jgi:hypothetical protein